MNERQVRILLVGMLLSTVTIVGVFFIGIVFITRRMTIQSDRMLGQGRSLGADAAGREIEQSLQYEDIRGMFHDSQQAYARIEKGQAALTEIFNRVERLDPRNGKD